MYGITYMNGWFLMVKYGKCMVNIPYMDGMVLDFENFVETYIGCQPYWITEW